MKALFGRLTCVVFILLGGLDVQGQEVQTLEVITPPLGFESRDYNQYFIDLADLALHLTESSDGPYRLSQHEAGWSRGRYFAELRQGRNVSLMWAVSTPQRNQVLRPVSVPLMKGLNGYRVFIIRREDEQRFAAIETLEQLKQWRGAAVSYWADVDVFEKYQLPVELAGRLELLYRMLKGGRFDYLPRGIHEVASELSILNDPELVMEQHIAFFYPSPLLFYVGAEDASLADRLRRGLLLAQADGSFDALFFNSPHVRSALTELRQHPRRVFVLDSGHPFPPALEEKIQSWPEFIRQWQHCEGQACTVK